MPQLPSGLRLAVDTGLLDKLIADASTGTGSSIPALMNFSHTDHLDPYLRFVWLEEDLSPGATPPSLAPGSLPMDTPIRTVLSGFTLADWETFAATLSAADAEATMAFLQSERHQNFRSQLLAEVQERQTELLNHPDPNLRIQAAWARAGVHPVQTGEDKQGFWEGAFEPPLPDDDAETPQSEVTDVEPCGHGGHWAALGLSEQTILDAVGAALERATSTADFSPPWPGDPMHRCLYCTTNEPDLAICTIVGQPQPKAAAQVLSSYPWLRRTSPWKLCVHEVTDIYGAFEGVVVGTSPHGASLQWFAPQFGLEQETWQQCVQAGEATVEVAGLALSMHHYPAEPIVVKTGPVVDMRREELRAEGRHAEAEDPDLSVTFLTSSLRSIFSTYQDHCEYVGKILYLDEVQAPGLPTGWWIQLECLPDHENDQLRSLPIFVFPTALMDGYIPKIGDLVSGVLWLQGSNPKLP